HCVGLEALNDRQTVYSRHMVVEQDQIRPLRPRLRETLTATQGREGTMTLLRKQFGGHLENQRVVVDDEDCKGHRVLSSIAQRRAGVQHRTASSLYSADCLSRYAIVDEAMLGDAAVQVNARRG